MVVNETLRYPPYRSECVERLTLIWGALFIATAITAEVLFYSDCTNCT